VAGEQVVDLAGHLHPASRQQDEVVGHPLELGQRVRGQHHGQPTLLAFPLPCRRHDRGHEVVPGQRVEHGQRLVEHEQPRPPGQGQRQRELRLLPAGQLARLLLQRDAELGQPALGVALIPAPVHVAGQVQHVRGGQVLVQRRVLRDERGAVQRGRRSRQLAAQHGGPAHGRRGQADRHVQQRGLACPVRTDQRDHVPLGDRQRALAHRPRAPVPLAQPRRLNDVHGLLPVLPFSLMRRPPFRRPPRRGAGQGGRGAHGNPAAHW